MEKPQFLPALSVTLWMLLIMWIIQSFQFFSGISLFTFGNLPRETDGLPGIISSFWIHGDWGHLVSNTTAFVVLNTMLFYFYKPIAWRAFVLLYLFSGILVWLFARSSYHIGASGVIYAEVAFIAWLGIFRRDFKSIGLALVVVVMYGGMFTGIIPTDTKISWESHLLGSIAGIFTAYIVGDIIPTEKSMEQLARERLKASESPEAYLFPPDLFEMTRNERKLFEEKKRQEALKAWLEQQQMGYGPYDHT